MKKRALFISVISATILVLVCIAPSINANVDELFVEALPKEEATPIEMVFQLIDKLRNHKDIKNVESEDDVIRIIESDEELNSIYEQLSGNDCGCEDDSSTLEWRFPVICMLLFPMFVLGLIVYMMGQNDLILVIVLVIGMPLNCRWIP